MSKLGFSLYSCQAHPGPWLKAAVQLLGLAEATAAARTIDLQTLTNDALSEAESCVHAPARMHGEGVKADAASQHRVGQMFPTSSYP